MSQNQSRQDLLKILAGNLQVFNQLQMKESSKGMQSVIVEASQRAINSQMLTMAFMNLQSDVRAEFGANDYRKRLWSSLTSRIISATQEHHELIEAMNNSPTHIEEMTKDRMNIFKVQNIFNNVIVAGAKTDEEQCIAASFLYSFTVEGIYKRSIQDCFIWEKLGKGESPNVEKALAMDISNIHDYYTTKNLDLVIFEGYDSTVRNAVSHSTFNYSSSEKKVIYTDRIKGKTVSHAFGALEELYKKLKDLYLYVLIRNVLLSTSDVCSILMTTKYS